MSRGEYSKTEHFSLIKCLYLGLQDVLSRTQKADQSGDQSTATRQSGSTAREEGKGSNEYR